MLLSLLSLRPTSISETLPGLATLVGLGPVMRSVVADSAIRNLEQHELAKAWFLLRGYHREQFTTEEGERMLLELKSIALLWPDGAPVEFIRQHGKWQLYGNHNRQ